MAPLFSQRQKVPEELTTMTNQSQTEDFSSGNPVSGSGGGSAGSVHYMLGSSSEPPLLPPLRQPRPNTNSNTTDTTAIRKYLVLLQDCLAIKFAPLVNGHQSHPYPFAFNGGTNGSNNPKNGINSTPDEEDDDLLLPHQGPTGNHHRIMSNGGGGAKCGSNSISNEQHLHNRSGCTQGFKEANAQCHWNSALSATFQNIQYKGYIVPSTVLVGALPKFLSMLRTAWSRQMLRSPAGYRIEFIGEIEEVIADPIQKGQFAPLSDSLCWAILELTSTGQEAFVDSIMSALHLAFPTMSCPSRELVFQTLEKLIKERKVYQTSRGYFVVTPEIFRYMVNANLHEFEGNGNSNNFAGMAGGQGVMLDALLHPHCPDQDKLSFSHQSWDSAVSTGDHNRCSSTSTGEELIEVQPSPKLKRHNSLKLIRQRDVAVTQMSGGTGHRRYSLRLPKSKSCGRMNEPGGEEDEEVKRVKGKSSTMEHISRAMRSLRTATSSSNGNGDDSEKSKKNKSLLSKLFPFRRSTSKPRNEKIPTPQPPSSEAAAAPAAAVSGSGSGSSPRNSTSCSSDSNADVDADRVSPPTKTKHSENPARDSAKFISTQTQTSNSTEQLCGVPLPSISVEGSGAKASSSQQQPAAPAGSLSVTLPPSHAGGGGGSGGGEKIPGRMTAAVDSTPEHSSAELNMLHHQHQQQHHVHYRHHHEGEGSHQTRSSSRRSMSILDESPLYDVLQDVPSPNHSNNGGSHQNHHHHHHAHHISPNFQVGCPVAPPTFPSYHHRGESSRCSTLSSQAASSLGYGSQGHPSLGSNCNYSPNNMDSGLASASSCGYYGGEGSNYGYNSHGNRNEGGGNGGNSFPQPGKPSAYSSSRYKNSYEWYKKRYPNYISSPVGRSSPLYASLTAPRSKSRSRPSYDSLLTPVEGRHGHGGGLVQMSENRGNSATPSPGTKNDKVMMMSPGSNDNSNVSTTTVTQAVKSTTNMEMQLLLPLGKIMKAALHAKKDAIRDAWLRDEMGPTYAKYANSHQAKTGGDNESANIPIKVNLDGSGAKLRVGEPNTKTEVTTVVNNNGVIETHFDSNSNPPPSMKSTMEIKTLGGVTDIVLVNGKTGEETKIMNKKNNNNGLKDKDNCKNPTHEKISSACVKISDIGPDCGVPLVAADKDVIKVC